MKAKARQGRCRCRCCAARHRSLQGRAFCLGNCTGTSMSQPSPITHALKPTASLQAAEVTSDRRKRKRKHREEDFAANSTLNHHIPHITQLDGDPQEKTKNRKKHKHRVLPLLDDPPTNLDSTSDTLANPLTVSKLSSDAESREERKARKKREKALRFSSTTAGIIQDTSGHVGPTLSLFHYQARRLFLQFTFTPNHP